MRVAGDGVPARDGAEPLLRAEGLVKHFRTGASGPFRRSGATVRAVDDVSLQVGRGETLAIVGETGCGKSTLARCLTRLCRLDAGRVVFDGVELSRLSQRALRPYRRDVQMIFQDPHGALNPRRRVGSIIAEPLTIQGIASDRERTRRVRELMELVGLNTEHYGRFPAEFSGGQRQRVALARALALRPRLLVCDEPVSALDASIQAQVINLLADLQHEFGLSYIVIAHDLSVVRHVSDRVAVMYLGEIVELAGVRQLFTTPRHPYTTALLSAVPAADPDTAARPGRVVLAGDVPSAEQPPPGCRFHTRCPKVGSRCVDTAPILQPRLGDGPDHRAACHFPMQAGEQLG